MLLVVCLEADLLEREEPSACGLARCHLDEVAQSCVCPCLEKPFWVYVRLQKWKKDPIEMLALSSHAANQTN